jgi:NTP pyrophosphatase (non-canonical NTP hydrolase)
MQWETRCNDFATAVNPVLVQCGKIPGVTGYPPAPRNTVHDPNHPRTRPPAGDHGRLRDPQGGCEWDLAQSFATIAPYTIEEAYEVADAIARNDIADLREELGDLLLQVVFHSRIAQEAGHFDFDAVAAAIADKMEARHPHIFAAQDDTGQSRQDRWENAKEAERAAKGAQSALDGVALALPALMRAEKAAKARRPRRLRLARHIRPARQGDRGTRRTGRRGHP